MNTQPHNGRVLARANAVCKCLKAARGIIDDNTRVLLTADNDRLALRISEGAYIVEVVEHAVQVDAPFSCSVAAKLLGSILELADDGRGVNRSGKPRHNDAVVKMELYQVVTGPVFTITDYSGRFNLWVEDRPPAGWHWKRRYRGSDPDFTAKLLTGLVKLDDGKTPVREAVFGVEPSPLSRYVGESFTLTVCGGVL